MLTRARIECSGKTEDAVKLELTEWIDSLRAMADGIHFEEEPPGIEIQTTRSGYWGRVAVRRINA